jgi:hypothetical protein
MHVRMVRTITALPHKLSSFDFVPQILEVRLLVAPVRAHTHARTHAFRRCRAPSELTAAHCSSSTTKRQTSLRCLRPPVRRTASSIVPPNAQKRIWSRDFHSGEEVSLPLGTGVVGHVASTGG